MRESKRPHLARLTSSTYSSGRVENAIEILSHSSMPALCSLEGYCGGAVLVNREHARVLTLTLWGAGAADDLLAGVPGALSDILTISRDWSAPLVRETMSVYVYEMWPSHRTAPGIGHARLTTMRVKPQHWDLVVAAGHDTAIALKREQSGFNGAIAVGNRATGQATFIELWENRAALRASESAAYRQERAARAVRMLVGVPQHAVYQIEYLHLGPVATAS